VLQCVAMSCSVLPCVAMSFSVLQCVAGCCRVLQCVSVCCSMLQGVQCVAAAREVSEHHVLAVRYHTQSFAKEPYKRDDILQKRPIITMMFII